MSTIGPQGWAACVRVLRYTCPRSDHSTGFRLQTQRWWDDSTPCTSLLRLHTMWISSIPRWLCLSTLGLLRPTATLKDQRIFWLMMSSLANMVTCAPLDLCWTTQKFLYRRDYFSFSAMDPSPILGKTFLVLWFIFSSSPCIWSRGFREREIKMTLRN